jgi:hypothetical protein
MFDLSKNFWSIEACVWLSKVRTGHISFAFYLRFFIERFATLLSVGVFFDFLKIFWRIANPNYEPAAPIQNIDGHYFDSLQPQHYKKVEFICHSADYIPLKWPSGVSDFKTGHLHSASQ